MDNREKNIESDNKTFTFNTKLVCINYPGIVNNVDKMIETLGGMSEIENNIGNKRKMLDLRFRPEDKYSKPAGSELDKRPGILVKLIPKESINVAEEKQDFNYEVIGVTALSYSFNKLCDFQYLPLVSTEEKEESKTPLKYIYNEIIPNQIPENGWIFDTDSDNMSYYLPPAIFSRYDNPLNHLYFDRSKFYEGRFKPEYAEMLRQQEIERKNSRSIDQKVIAKKSGHGGLFTSFYDHSVPSEPPKLALQFLNMRYTNKGAYEKIKGLFDERPVWSRAAILYVSEVPKEQLKFILPAVSYHFYNGPWRIMWVRYGYDPRKDSSSKIYQTFDFRVRATAGLKAKVRTKRQHNSQRYMSRSPANIVKISLNEVVENTEEKNLVDESAFILKPGMVPPARQMFYQYCDVHLHEIQSMLNRLPPVMPGTVCDYKNGWLPNKFTDQCREIANKYIVQHVRKMIQEENKRQVEQGTSDPSANSTKNVEEQNAEDFLEISDSDNDSEYLPSDSSDEDYIQPGPSKSSGTKYKKKVETLNVDEDDAIDMEAVNDVNKLLQEDFAALKDFDRLVYDSD